MVLKFHSLFKTVALSISGVIVIYFGTLLSFELPNSDIPQTAQTLAVLVVSAILGAVSGFLAVVIYLLLGVIGFPVFANGASGMEIFSGPSSGYLFGFISAAIFCGWWFRNYSSRNFSYSSLGMMLSHILILLMGWLWLSSIVGFGSAFEKGVKPFLMGAIVKSLLASIIVMGYCYFVERIKQSVANKRNLL